MAKFDYMEFDTVRKVALLVFDVKKHIKEEAVKIFNEEYDYLEGTTWGTFKLQFLLLFLNEPLLLEPYNG